MALVHRRDRDVKFELPHHPGQLRLRVEAADKQASQAIARTQFISLAANALDVKHAKPFHLCLVVLDPLPS